ncbi:hypothetical protein D3C72_1224270 [compost metagenome]
MALLPAVQPSAIATVLPTMAVAVASTTAPPTAELPPTAPVTPEPVMARVTASPLLPLPHAFLSVMPAVACPVRSPQALALAAVVPTMLAVLKAPLPAMPLQASAVPPTIV